MTSYNISYNHFMCNLSPRPWRWTVLRWSPDPFRKLNDQVRHVCLGHSYEIDHKTTLYAAVNVTDYDQGMITFSQRPLVCKHNTKRKSSSPHIRHQSMWYPEAQPDHHVRYIPFTCPGHDLVNNPVTLHWVNNPVNYNTLDCASNWNSKSTAELSQIRELLTRARTWTEWQAIAATEA